MTNGLRNRKKQSFKNRKPAFVDGRTGIGSDRIVRVPMATMAVTFGQISEQIFGSLINTKWLIELRNTLKVEVKKEN